MVPIATMPLGHFYAFSLQISSQTFINITSRLLERNVRAFLSFRSRVNQGILDTLRNEPERFIAYNNGLTVTARELELSADEKSILRIDGLQVVNGGQTTNTIYRAKYMEKLPLGRASVPVKLCVLSDETADEVAPLIAKFANSQNVVKRTDLTSNHPVYRELEKLSRSTLAPAQDGGSSGDQVVL